MGRTCCAYSFFAIGFLLAIARARDNECMHVGDMFIRGELAASWGANHGTGVGGDSSGRRLTRSGRGIWSKARRRMRTCGWRRHRRSFGKSFRPRAGMCTTTSRVRLTVRGCNSIRSIRRCFIARRAGRIFLPDTDAGILQAGRSISWDDVRRGGSACSFRPQRRRRRNMALLEGSREMMRI